MDVSRLWSLCACVFCVCMCVCVCVCVCRMAQVVLEMLLAVVVGMPTPTPCHCRRRPLPSPHSACRIVVSISAGHRRGKWSHPLLCFPRLCLGAKAPTFTWWLLFPQSLAAEGCQVEVTKPSCASMDGVLGFCSGRCWHSLGARDLGSPPQKFASLGAFMFLLLLSLLLLI